ncbi:MAG: hypothetical protein H6709_11025 [Kofleriaceae bacterium]|nr:hypothetical protein [Kofleriaceae bacterium]
MAASGAARGRDRRRRGGGGAARLPGATIEVGDVLAGEPVADVDLVVGNPPWVRPDRLPPARRDRLAAAITADAAGVLDADDVAVLARRADLAAACVLRAVRLTRPGGVVALVLSTALLDAGYAGPLWRAVAARGRVRCIAAAPAERWFAEAAVNAMIVVIEVGAIDDAPVEVVRLRVPTAAAAAAAAAAGGGLDAIGEIRRAPATAPEQWARALRAPAAWFELARLADGALVPLGELAELRRGITSGANDVFYLTRARAAEAGIEADALAPLVHSPRDGAALAIAIDPDETPLCALVLPPGGLAGRPRAHRWIRAHADAAARPSLRGRDPWWALPARPARLFLTKAYGPRFLQRLAPRPVLADQRVYAVEPRPGVPLELLAASLNTTWTALALEALGRGSMGNGAVEWTVADAARLPVLDIRRADRATARRITAALAALAPRPVRHVTVERDLPDRRALDLALAALAPGLAPLLPATHDALCAAVALRDRWKLPTV